MTFRCPDAARPRATHMAQQLLQPQAAARPQPRALDAFGTGCLLRELPARPTIGQSLCEAAMSFIGFESPITMELRSRYNELVELCACLPRSVPAYPDLDRKIENLRIALTASRPQTIAPSARFEELNRLERLIRRADRLAAEVARRAVREIDRRESSARDLSRSPEAARAQPVSSFWGANSSVDSLPEVEEPAPRALPRRRDVRAEVAEHPAVQAEARPPYPLDREALARALAPAQAIVADGRKLTGIEMDKVARNIVRLVNGRFVSPLSHPSFLRARQYGVWQTVQAATRFMRDDQRDAIRAAAREMLGLDPEVPHP